MHLKRGQILKTVKCSTISSINILKEGVTKMFGHVEHRPSDAVECKIEWIQVGEVKWETTKVYMDWCCKKELAICILFGNI